jgi:WhiB family transcriptional regulator, redox-sensing transcriptional regulator
MPEPVTDPDQWRVLARCATVDPDLWFPTQGGYRAIRKQVKDVCDRCEVSQQCLADALKLKDWADEYGIRAGTTPKQRRRLRAAQRGG